LLIETLPLYFSGEIQPIPQPEEGVTFAPQIEKEEGHIKWAEDAVVIERLVRAFTPWPGTFSYWKGKQLKIHKGSIGEGSLDAGKVGMVDGRLAIGTGLGLFFPMELQLEGKSRVDIKAFVNGYTDFVGSVLE
jgi:methionyl-tRNA formyltransferase